MNFISIALAATMLAAAPPPAKRTKAQAPVAVAAELAARSARVSVTFVAPGKDVDISVSGVDGLVVTGATPVSGMSFQRNEVSVVDVTFAPAAGRSHLVVVVTGRFGGARRVKVASFAVGAATAEQKRSAGDVRDVDGRRVEVLPAQPR